MIAIGPKVISFRGSDDHRDLHSFPTRRSSDLKDRLRSGTKDEHENMSRGLARVDTDRGDPDRRPSATVRGYFSTPSCAVFSDRKSTRLNSSHANISYAVFCLKKKSKQTRVIHA